MPERVNGVVATWLNHKGFGFITPEGQESEVGKDILVRFDQLKQSSEDGFKSLAEGSKVEFEIQEDEKNPGKKLAINVTGENGEDCEPRKKGQGKRVRKPKAEKKEGEESEEKDGEAKEGEEKKKGSGKRRSRKGRGKGKGKGKDSKEADAKKDEE